MSDDFWQQNPLENAVDWASEHKVETAIGLLAICGIGGVVGRKVLQNAAAREVAPTLAMEVAEGVTARGVGRGVMFAMEDGTSVLARRGMLEVTTPKVAGTLRVGKNFEIALADGTKIETGGLGRSAESILVQNGKASIRPPSVHFGGGELHARSIYERGETVSVLSGRFGNVGIENAAGNQLSIGQMTFRPEGYTVGPRFLDGRNTRSYATLLEDLSH